MPLFDHAPCRKNSDSHKWQKYAGSDIIPAWVADTDFPAPPPVLDALAARLRHGVFGYADIPRGMPEVICDYFWRRWHWRISPPDLFFLPGLGAAIHIVCRMAASGDILTPSPVYHVFRRAPAIAKARRVDIRMMKDDGGVWRLSTGHLREKAAGRQARLFQLCNPHNPNGKIYERDELLDIAAFCEERDLLICADEVHADLILDEDKKHLPIASLDESIARRVITLQSPSKAFNIAGLNFAVAVVPEVLRAQFLRAAAGKVITHLNPFGLAAANAAWSGECDEWLQKSNAHLRANRDKLSAAVKKIPGITMPHLPATYLAWLNVGAMGLKDAPRHFESFGIGMSPGADFGDADYMRLNFGCTPEVLDDIITRLTRAARKRKT